MDFMENASVNDTVKIKSDTVNDTVFNLIKENPTITTEEIRIKLNIGIATVKRKIKNAERKRYYYPAWLR